MPTLLYRFDDASVFPLLDTLCTARASVTISEDDSEAGCYLRITADRLPDGPSKATIAVALPLLGTDGAPERLLLEVLGGTRGCELFVDAGDARGGGLTYSLGCVDFTGWGTLAANVDQPAERWGERAQPDRSPLLLPVQFYRIGIVIPQKCQYLDIGLHSLSVTGRVRLCSPGIARHGDPPSSQT